MVAGLVNRKEFNPGISALDPILNSFLSVSFFVLLKSAYFTT